MSGNWDAALGEHRGNNGFVEGPNNDNPWGPEQGVYNQSYCASASCMVAYHNGVRFPAGSQFGEKGWAYCPYIVADGEAMGITEFDHASGGDPASMTPGDFALFDWAGDGVADHVETIIATYSDGTYDTVGYNTGSPEGCHVPIRRDRSYLLAVVHVRTTFYDGEPQPEPEPPPEPEYEDDMALSIVAADGGDGTQYLTDLATFKTPIADPDSWNSIVWCTVAAGGKLYYQDVNNPVLVPAAVLDTLPKTSD